MDARVFLFLFFLLFSSDVCIDSFVERHELRPLVQEANAYGESTAMIQNLKDSNPIIFQSRYNVQQASPTKGRESSSNGLDVVGRIKSQSAIQATLAPSLLVFILELLKRISRLEG